MGFGAYTATGTTATVAAQARIQKKIRKNIFIPKAPFLIPIVSYFREKYNILWGVKKPEKKRKKFKKSYKKQLTFYKFRANICKLSRGRTLKRRRYGKYPKNFFEKVRKNV